MARIFVSHASQDNAFARQFVRWLDREGLDDVFLDIDPERGILGGTGWAEALYRAGRRCRVVICLVSKHWLKSEWCLREFEMGRKKAILTVLIDQTPVDEIPGEIRHFQMIDISQRQDEAYSKVRASLTALDIDPNYFVPTGEGAPFKGLFPFNEDDAAFYFGRDSYVRAGLEMLRAPRRDPSARRLLLIAGDSGVGKTSFLRAGLLPRLTRNQRDFFALPVVRPGKNWSTAFAESLSIDFISRRLGSDSLGGDISNISRILREPQGLEVILKLIRDGAESVACYGESPVKPNIVLCIDQLEELFTLHEEDIDRLQLLSQLLDALHRCSWLQVVFCVRTDFLERLYASVSMPSEHLMQIELSILPAPMMVEVIREPVRVLARHHALTQHDSTSSPAKVDVEPDLVEAVVYDAQGLTGALPFVSYLMSVLWGQHSRGSLTRADYERYGGFEQLVDDAIRIAIENARVSPGEGLDTIARAFVPAMVDADPSTGKVAPREVRFDSVELPPSLLVWLMYQRVIIRRGDSAATINDTVIRYWKPLKTWLKTEEIRLRAIFGVRRAAVDWDSAGRPSHALLHNGSMLRTLEAGRQVHFLNGFTATENAYLTACRQFVGWNRRKYLFFVVFVAMLSSAATAALLFLVCLI